MAGINLPALEDAPAETQAVLEIFKKRFGFVPNLFRLMAMNPNVLAAFVGIQGSLQKTMNLKTIEAMGMAVSDRRGPGSLVPRGRPAWARRRSAVSGAMSSC